LKNAGKSIWIDLDNSPHVPLFAPIIRHYRRLGVEVVLTARDHSQTLELIELQGFAGTFKVIGRHYGSNKLAKAWGLIIRASKLVSYIAGLQNRPSVAVSHGSRSMVVAARWLRIPILTMYDYEFTETRIFNRFSEKVMVPEQIPDEVFDSIGLPSKKRVKYPGIKEELYVRTFEPTPGCRENLFKRIGVEDSDEKVLVVVRPPATTANYHSEKSEVLLDDILDFLLNAPDVLTIVVPRTREQGEAIRASVSSMPDALSRSRILDEAVDGLDLAFASDLLISGGGTMNREAALLGVPVYSIFAGRQGALDREMEAEGLITFIRDARDLSKIRLEQRVPNANAKGLTSRVEDFVIKQIDTFLQ
jgi:predicted glycosyltransferase